MLLYAQAWKNPKPRPEPSEEGHLLEMKTPSHAAAQNQKSYRKAHRLPNRQNLPRTHHQAVARN